MSHAGRLAAAAAAAGVPGSPTVADEAGKKKNKKQLYSTSLCQANKADHFVPIKAQDTEGTRQHHSVESRHTFTYFRALLKKRSACVRARCHSWLLDRRNLLSQAS